MEGSGVVQDVSFRPAKPPRVVEVVDVEAGHLRPVVMVERCARGAHRVHGAARRRELLPKATVKVTVQHQPVFDAGEPLGKVASVVKAFEHGLER